MQYEVSVGKSTRTMVALTPLFNGIINPHSQEKSILLIDPGTAKLRAKIPKVHSFSRFRKTILKYFIHMIKHYTVIVEKVAFSKIS